MTAVFLEGASRDMAAWSEACQKGLSFSVAQDIALTLGAHVLAEAVRFGFWIPEITEKGIPEERIFLELFTPLETIDPRVPEQVLKVRYQRLPVVLGGDFAWVVVQGLQLGTRDKFGTLYHLSFQNQESNWQVVRDHLATSLPFGAFAPAELIDMNAMLVARGDKAYFENLDGETEADGVLRVKPPVNILQIHVPTATAEGTLAGLSSRFQGIFDKQALDRALDPVEQAFVGYEAVQLMPVEPTIEYEQGAAFWELLEIENDQATVSLRRPDMTNWGYDVPISGSAAVNPVLLGTGRPHELLDFIQLMHSRGIKVIFDIVYGHTDNQARGVLNRHFLAGAGMYGQNINFQHPLVRAILLEMQRRKASYGIDGLRVDGAQDFKYWDVAARQLRYDDGYLRLMNSQVLEVAGRRYRPYMIFEDGRPWPQDDWELASSYREVTRQLPNVHQWGPLTFAHNTPFLFTFWLQKWWRIREIADLGQEWITGCANHDTLRRGTQVPLDARINSYLGNSLPEVLWRAYDNPAARLFDYALMPGVPMDFLNASLRAAWSFIRNTDDRYGVKIMADEALFLFWSVDETAYDLPDNYRRLKGLGFSKLSLLRSFVMTIGHAIKMTDYQLSAVASVLATLASFPADLCSETGLKRCARAWMEDLHDYCNVTRHEARLDAEHLAWQRSVREFRKARPWLSRNFGPDDHLGYLHPSQGSVVIYGLRQAPDAREQILFIANMEGASCEVLPLKLPIPGLVQNGWECVIHSAKTSFRDAASAVMLVDSEGIVLRRVLM